uniref:Major facilitator superfamily (MFS) profile domain-containing protein n=1 Tax=Globodera rostochiensis TaxID=31243 RepID=A0A914HEX0_GLORO
MDHFDDQKQCNATVPAPLVAGGYGDRSSCCCSSVGFRYAILLVTVLCLTTICSNMIAFNFTLILMRRPNWENVSYPADSHIVTSGHWNISADSTSSEFIVLNDSTVVPPTVPYSAIEKSRLLYAVGLASMVSTFPFSALYTRYGARYVFFAAGVISTLATALLPMAAGHGMAAFMVIRVFQGFAYGANFAAIGFVCHRWASLRQHGFFLACMTNFTSIAVTVTNPVAAFVSSTPALGWPWVYYVHALVSPLLFVTWLLIYTDHPECHKCVSDEEKFAILDGKTPDEIEIHGYMPYSAILSNKVIWVVWLNAFADIVTAVFLITYLPTYVSKVLGYGVRETGIWSAVPALLHIPVKIGAGWMADTLTCMNEVNRMRMFNSLALVGSGIMFALTGFVPEKMPFLAVILMTMNFAVVSTNCGGFYKCATLISRQFAHFVVAGIQFEKSVTLFVSPLIFLLFIKDESSHEQWRNVFLGMSVVLVIANTFFWFLADDQPAEFTKEMKKRKQISPELSTERKTNGGENEMSAIVGSPPKF